MSKYYSGYFTVEELQCPDTGDIVLEGDFIHHLEMLRTAYGYPMIVTSCCRNIFYNKKVGGHPRSLHLINNKHHKVDTCAIDITRPQGDLLHKLVHEAVKREWSVGIADDFIHLDLRSRYLNLPPRIYTY